MSEDTPHTTDRESGQVSEATVAADERDATVAHDADRAPTADEEVEAERRDDLPPAAAEAYKEAIERGAAVKGEGQIDL